MCHVLFWASETQQWTNQLVLPLWEGPKTDVQTGDDRGPPWVWQLGRACPPCIFSQTELVGFLGGASGKELSFFTEICTCHGLYLWLSNKESSCNAGDAGNAGSIPGLGRPLGKGIGNPLQYFCLRNPMDKEAWRATVHGVTSQTELSMQARHSLA